MTESARYIISICTNELKAAWRGEMWMERVHSSYVGREEKAHCEG